MTRQVHVFGREAHLAVVLEAESTGYIIEIGHVLHIDPCLRNGDDDIGVTEIQLVEEDHLPVRIGQVLADEVFAGHREVNCALAEELHNLGRGNIGDLEV